MITVALLLIAHSSDSTLKGSVVMNGKPVRDATVWLQNAGASKPIMATIRQKDKTFTPHITIVPMGSTIDFPNDDGLSHNVFAEYNAKKFDLGMYSKGQTRKVTFDKPGVVSILCNLHSNMSAYVMVVNSGFYTKTDRSGNFELQNVPSGSYEIKAWHESGSQATQKVSFTAGAPGINLSLSR